MAGSLADLGALAWVECKHCGYRGVGLGKETIDHSHQHLGATLEDFTIFCRLCHSKKGDEEKASDVLDDVEEFETHVREKHQDIIKCMEKQSMKTI